MSCRINDPLEDESICLPAILLAVNRYQYMKGFFCINVCFIKIIRLGSPDHTHTECPGFKLLLVCNEQMSLEGDSVTPIFLSCSIYLYICHQ